AAGRQAQGDQVAPEAQRALPLPAADPSVLEGGSPARPERSTRYLNRIGPKLQRTRNGCSAASGTGCLAPAGCRAAGSRLPDPRATVTPLRFAPSALGFDSTRL